MRTFAHNRDKILEHIEHNSVVSVAELATELKCSEMTVRRHLTQMEAEGLVERSRGGATATRRVRLEFALQGRSMAKRAEKRAIARAAAELVKEGDRIVIDTGTTTLALAHELRKKKGISVVTTSLAIVSELLHAPGVECILLGGVVRENSPDLYGPMLEENLSRIHADRAFIGCDAVSARGDLMTTDHRVARATTMMIENSSQTVLLTDSSKANQSAFIQYGTLDQVDVLVTDEGMPKDILQAARRGGAETIVARTSEKKSEG